MEGDLSGYNNKGQMQASRQHLDQNSSANHQPSPYAL
jgi:hypothetical protein